MADKQTPERKSKLEIIQETAAHYNLGNRSVADGGCLYIGPEGKHCALGRCCDLDDPKKVELLLNYNSAVSSLILDGEFGQEILKPEYRGHEFGFWRDVQLLHDDIGNWTETGLSESGEAAVKFLIKKWS